MQRKGKVFVTRILVSALVLGTLAAGKPEETEAAVKPKLSKSKLSVQKGRKKKITVKNSKKAKVMSVKWKIKDRKIASLFTKKKTTKWAFEAQVKGKKEGKTTLTAVVKTKKRKKPFQLKCRITVTDAKTLESKAPAASSASASQAPIGSVSPTAPVGSDVPSSASPSSSAMPASIKEAYSGVIDNVGTCISYSHWDKSVGKQMQDSEKMAFVKKHFNSFTLENEMKPDSVLKGNGWPATGAATISVSAAEKKGYVIPEGYAEDVVPELNFDTLDKVLAIAKDAGLRMRAHVLQWHQQTPEWFFLEGYKNSGAEVTQEVMDARLEFYVRSVMKHILEKEKELTGSAGSLVYVWDVTNEYIHRTNNPSSTSWMDIYGDMGLQPIYVKRAFELAYDMLEQYGVQDDVTLFYNDYDTYFCSDDVVSLVNYINEGEKAQICGGIGMQSHVDVDRPTIEEYGAALDKFLATGLQVQITELDMTINFGEVSKENWGYKDEGQTDEDQAEFCEKLMRLIVSRHKNRDTKVNPKGVTGVTIWGLYDSVSWRAKMNPLLFGTSINDPKPSYEAFLRAASAD